MIIVSAQWLPVAKDAMTMGTRIMFTALIVTTNPVMSITLRPGATRMDRSRQNWLAPAAGTAAYPRS
jgi:hypothetical protein